MSLSKLQKSDLRTYAVIGLLVLWAALTFSIALTEISIVFALVCWIFSGLWRNKDSNANSTSPKIAKTNPTLKPLIDWPLWIPLLLFFIIVISSFFTSEYPKQSLQGLLKIVKPLLVFLMLGDLLQSTPAQRKFGQIFLSVFLVITIDCSFQYAFGKDLLRHFAAEDSSAGLRLVGPFGNFAKMATYLVLVVPVFAMRFWSEFAKLGRRGNSFYLLALATAGFLLLYLTRCRGAMLALVFSMLVLFVYKRWFKALRITLLLCLIIVAVMPKHMIFHYDVTKKEQSLRERYRLWKRALNVIEAKPLTGTGINTYNVAHAKYDKEKHWRVRGYYAHNGYLQLAAEIGLPGIFCFLWFLFMFFKRSLASAKQVRGSPEEYIQLGFMTALLAFLIYATADNNLQSPPSLMMFWYLAGVLRARQLAAKIEITPPTLDDQNRTLGIETGGTVPA